MIVIALSTRYVSPSARLMTGGIVQVQRQLEEAAEASGASWGPTLRRIVLPIVLPTFVNGFLLVFLNAIRNLALALVLYTPASIVLSTLADRYWDHADTAETAAQAGSAPEPATRRGRPAGGESEAVARFRPRRPVPDGFDD